MTFAAAQTQFVTALMNWREGLLEPPQQDNLKAPRKALVGFESLVNWLDHTTLLAANALLNVAVIGAPKAGKTSVCLSLLGPHGAILKPLATRQISSSVLLQLRERLPSEKGEETAVTVEFRTGKKQVIAADRLTQYASESGNPKNKKEVERVHVVLPRTETMPLVALNDTPGFEWQPHHTTHVKIALAESHLTILVLNDTITQPHCIYLESIKDKPGGTALVVVQNPKEYDDETSARQLKHNLREIAKLGVPVSASFVVNPVAHADEGTLKLRMFLDAESRKRSLPGLQMLAERTLTRAKKLNGEMQQSLDALGTDDLSKQSAGNRATAVKAVCEKLNVAHTHATTKMTERWTKTRDTLRETFDKYFEAVATGAFVEDVLKAYDQLKANPDSAGTAAKPTGQTTDEADNLTDPLALAFQAKAVAYWESFNARFREEVATVAAEMTEKLDESLVNDFPSLAALAYDSLSPTSDHLSMWKACIQGLRLAWFTGTLSTGVAWGAAAALHATLGVSTGGLWFAIAAVTTVAIGLLGWQRNIREQLTAIVVERVRVERNNILARCNNLLDSGEAFLTDNVLQSLTDAQKEAEAAEKMWKAIADNKTTPNKVVQQRLTYETVKKALDPVILELGEACLSLTNPDQQ